MNANYYVLKIVEGINTKKGIGQDQELTDFSQLPDIGEIVKKKLLHLNMTDDNGSKNFRSKFFEKIEF